MIRIGIDERRARLAVRHHIAPAERVDSAVAAARDMVCLHATDPASVYLSVWARMNNPTVAALEEALYQERSLVRMLAMRRTMFVVPVEDAPLMHAAAAIAVARNARKQNTRLVDMLGVDDSAEWLATTEADTLAALERRGEATAQELAADVPALRRKVRANVGKPYEGDIGMSTRVLLLLALEGKIVRGRPRGTWVSSQYRWAPMTGWLGHPLSEIEPEGARAGVVKRWLARFGPGTEADLRWWTGWTAVEIRRALAAVGALKVDLDGLTGFVLPDDLDPTPQPDEWVALLPSLDPTTMGWRGREWYLGDHTAALFDSNGNAGPTIWSDGRIVGGWAVRPNGEVVTKLLEDRGLTVERAVEAEAARLTGWLGGTKVTPRFATPLQRELVG